MLGQARLLQARATKLAGAFTSHAASAQSYVRQQRAAFSGPYVSNFLERKKGMLVLEDGSVFPGYSFGSEISDALVGECVFNTGMVGYNENLTDPSYRGEILSLTYPLIGNYGVPPMTTDELGLLKFFESDKIQVSALVVSQYEPYMSHWNADRTLEQWLKDEKIPGLAGVDTRKLTKRLREHGAMLGKIIFEGAEDVALSGEASPLNRNLVAEVSTSQVRTYQDPNSTGNDIRVVAVDCGIKNNIVRRLVQKGAKVTVVPWDYDFRTKLEGQYDGVFISNGPGDPTLATSAIQNLRGALQDDIPVFGICMGNQLLALAAGAKTYKLPFGNRGQNQPCMDLTTQRVYITPQNHGFAVDNNTLPAGWEPYFINTNDMSNEGIMNSHKPFFSVQFHPEARGGPEDTDFLFDKFLNTARDYRETKRFYRGAATKGGPKKVTKALILGSGGLQIGQAGEFDYSGSQCIKALKEEGVETVLINPNIATIMTGTGLADKVYFMPVTPEYVEKIIEKERPDGILLGFGGQTGLNCGVDLYRLGILEKYNVNVLGTSVPTIMKTEDRALFAQALSEIDQPYAPSVACETVETSLEAAEQIGYPVIVRAAYALGGLGSGFADNKQELKELVQKALSSSPQVLVEKSIKGWKEVEYEVVRDQYDNCLTVCNMENFDPMGIHTGESIVIAPSQTLSNAEYHLLRTAAINVVRHLGIVGECNIQYALDPFSHQYYIIEVNPRLSRSSALASKATGYPLAAVAAKIALGINLPQIRNAVTQKTTACFEPSLDYCVVKIPKWDLKKFTRVSSLLGSSMKSVGEVMGIGRTFEEALQKALRMVDPSNTGFEATKKVGDLATEINKPTDKRIYALADAMDQGWGVEKIHNLSKIDRWFLHKLRYIKDIEQFLRSQKTLKNVSKDQIRQAKQSGFSDAQIASFLSDGTTEEDVRQYRKSLNVLPVVKQIDTLAGEFPAQTNYLYMTYNGRENDVPKNGGGIVVLGSGVYRIGSSVEFDYCAVHCIRSLRKRGVRSIMINYNPETVSTDYDESDQLYFEELSSERVRDIYEHEGADGIVVSVGGQQPNNISMELHKSGLKILGTSAESIDMAEDRKKFSSMLDRVGVKQPDWAELTSPSDARNFASKVGYPVLVRPSYVLSGAAMNVAKSHEELEEFLSEAVEISSKYPVVISKFIEGAQEVECDAVAQNGQLINWAVALHIENAGVHSGDASHVLPCDLPDTVQVRVKDIAAKIAQQLKISGPFNTQFLLKDNELSVIETNLRASRSFPFVSKTLGINFIDTATRVFLGEQLQPDVRCARPIRDRVCVKVPQFSFQRLLGADPVLGVEMASTGEVACFGKDKYEAFMKAMLSVPAFKMPKKNILVSGKIEPSFINDAKILVDQGYELFATPEAAPVLKAAKVKFTALDSPNTNPSHPDNEKPNNVMNHIRTKSIHMTINFPDTKEDPTQYLIRRTSADFGVTLVTNREVASTLAECFRRFKDGGLEVKHWLEYFPAGQGPE